MLTHGIVKLRRLAASLGEVEIVGRFHADPAPSNAEDDTETDASDSTPGAGGAPDEPRTWETTGDRIEHALTRAGGRVWQRDLSPTLDVSQATVSRWLSRLEEQGRVERVEIGRKKLVVLPGHMPELATTGGPEQAAET